MKNKSTNVFQSTFERLLRGDNLIGEGESAGEWECDWSIVNYKSEYQILVFWELKNVFAAQITKHRLGDLVISNIAHFFQTELLH